jgi:hypothetical protein
MFDRRAANPRICAATLFVLAASGGIAFAQETPHTPASQPSARRGANTGGIWKAAVPLQAMSGEFDGFDPLGIASGSKIQADCSINWVNPDDGKRYCFSSGTSLEFFLDQPQRNIERARRSWKKMTSTRN